jgi:agmatine/peptidylarginine deiminase
MVDPSAPLSWRDVYRAVNESETRIVAAITDATKPIISLQSDHEQRLRDLELHGSSEAREAKRSVDALWIKHDALKLVVDANTARSQGAFGALGWGKQIVLVAMAVMGAIIAVAEFIARISQ